MKEYLVYINNLWNTLRNNLTDCICPWFNNKYTLIFPDNMDNVEFKKKYEDIDIHSIVPNQYAGDIENDWIDIKCN